MGRLGLILLAVLLGGCARYEFDIARPGAGLVAVKADAEGRFEEPPVKYRAVAKEDRLVLMLQNALSEPLELVGEESAAVDPEGRRHPLRSQTMAPGSSAKVILPPLRPRFEDEGEGRFSVGIQAAVGSPGRQDDAGSRQCQRQRPRTGFAESSEPLYLDYYSDHDSRYWDWEGESTVRLRLHFRSAAGKTWEHELILRKRKAS